MSVENAEVMDRIASNLALIAGAISTLAEAVNGTYAGKPIYAQQHSAQPAADAPAPAKRGRGRPVKGEETAAPAASAPAQASSTPQTTPAAAEVDPFATPAAAAAPAATLDQVRKALTDLKAAVSQDVALSVLKAAGGADNLAALAVDKYGAVVQAASQAIKTHTAKPEPEDPFAIPASTAPAAAPTIDDVRAEVIASSKRTSQDTVAKVVMDAGGKAAGSDGVFKPSWKALPESKYAEVLAALKALPTTK